MGGVPCAKIIINGRLQELAACLTIQSEATNLLLDLKGGFESEGLNKIISFEEGLIKRLESDLETLKRLNFAYSREGESNE